MNKVRILIALLLSLAGVVGCASETQGTEEENAPEIGLPSGNKADGFDEVIDPASCPDGAPKLVNGRPSTWTVIHYSAGDNNLEDALERDVNEMEAGHNGSVNVNIVTQMDRQARRGVWRYEIRPNANRERINSRLVGHSNKEPDSGDWRTLASFGKWATVCYPAEQYMVVVSGHGGGWSHRVEGREPNAEERALHAQAAEQGETLRLIAPDDTNHSRMYVNDLKKALAVIQRATKRDGDPSSLNRLVAYGSDACLMQTFEVGYELRNLVNYVIGSEETEPGNGWPYNTIVRELTARPSFFGSRHADLVSLIVDKYGLSYGVHGGGGRQDGTTLAAVDTGAMQRAKNRLDDVASLLTEVADATLVGHIITAAEESYTFGDGYTDIGQFLTKLRAKLIDAGLVPARGRQWSGDARMRTLREKLDSFLEEELPSLVIRKTSGPDFPEASGISAFFPRDNCGYGLKPEIYAHSEFALDSAWDELIAKVVDLADEAAVNDPETQFDGAGTSTFSYGESSFQGVATKCTLSNGSLSVYAAIDDVDETETDERAELSLEIDVASLHIKSASIYAAAADLYQSEYDLEVALATSEVVERTTYAGTGAVETRDRDGNVNGTIQVDFRCEGFVVNLCQDSGYED